MKTHLINAVCTMLDEKEDLHREGMAAHIEAQWSNGASGILVGGTMGLMQMQKTSTWLDMVEFSCEAERRKGEVIVGVGDLSTYRTLERIEAVAPFRPDGVVIITPFFPRLPEDALHAYFKAVADESPLPVYLYYLPSLTGVPLTVEFVARLASHPNIHGIKISAEYSWVKQLEEVLDEDAFRVIVAQAPLLSTLVRLGVREQLDGIYAVLPAYTAEIIRAAEAGEYEHAELLQSRLNQLLRELAHGGGVFPRCNVLLEAQDIEGVCFPRPFLPVSQAEKEEFLNSDLVRFLLSPPTRPAKDGVAVSAAGHGT